MCSYLACPNGGDQIAVVLKNVEDLDDPAGVAEYRDASVRDGQVKGQIVGGLQGRALLDQNEEYNTVAEP